ncbi:MAG: Glucuronide carrier protein [Pseudomonadota bacterium]|jgi:GPH family glycoside/pentoside/hexuronide:cation symporter
MVDSFTVVTSPKALQSEELPAGAAAAAPATAGARDKLPTSTKIAYATGGSIDIFGHWLYNNIVDPVYNVFLGLSPTQVSVVRAITLLVDACAGLFFGWASDNTRSRWGRRRPYVLLGSIAAGLGLPCLFMARPTWSSDQIFFYMVVSAVLYAPIIAAYNTPYQSLGAELTPDYNERTSVMSYKGVVQKAAGAAIGWALLFANLDWFNDPVTGKPDVARGAVYAAAICGAWMMLAGVVNFIFVKERYYANAAKQERSGFFKMFGDAFQCKPYLVLLGTALVYAVPTGLVGTLGFYALNYHVFKGDMAASGLIGGWSSMAYLACGLMGILVANRVSRVIGKHKTLIGALSVGLVAFGSSWWLYTPAYPELSILCNGLNGFSATGLWVVLPAMSADVIDFDELNSGKRREGAYSATFSWVMKVGMMFSMLIGGPLLQATGFDAKLGGVQSPETVQGIRLLFAGIPVIALTIALVLIQFYPLTTERMRDIRAQLELRRGSV